MMNTSRLYVADPHKWIKYFKPSEKSVTPEVSPSIKLSSPVQQTFEQAKSEILRRTPIKRKPNATSVISSLKRRKRRKPTRKTKQKKEPKNKTQKQPNLKRVKKKTEKKKTNQKKTSKKRQLLKQVNDIFGS